MRRGFLPELLEIAPASLSVLQKRRCVHEMLAQGLDAQRVRFTPQSKVRIELGAAPVEASAAVAQQHGDQVGVHLLDRRTAQGVHYLFERETRCNRFADLVERERFLEAEVLGLEPLLLEPTPNRVDHFFHLERLEDVVIRALLHRLDGRFDGPETSHDDRDHVRRVLADGPEELEAAHVRHLQVAQHQVEAVTRELDQCAAPVLCGANVETLHRQEVRENFPDHFLVVDHEDLRDVFA